MSPVGSSKHPARLRRFSAWICTIGVARATAMLAALSSLASLALTWLALRMMGHASMGDAFWISLLVPSPLALVFGGLSLALVASLEQAWSTVNEQAMLDALTGLSNRRRFVPAAQRELDLAQRHGQPLALVLLDVDHFKSINDAFGHVSGDAVLVEVAKRCQSALRTTDLLARWGGEEFIILLPNTPLAHARQLAERVREALVSSPCFHANDKAVRVTASLGAAEFRRGQGWSLDELIQRADVAMYQAKTAGRDCVAVADADKMRTAIRPTPAHLARS